ncbi:MAG: hypothetical protein WD491_12395 [Balneolales bacterium]
MITVELADYLLGLDKYIVEDGRILKNHELNLEKPMNLRLTLTAPEDTDQSLFVEIWESPKKSLKVTLHHQDDNIQVGLMRIDFNSRHKNPEEITNNVPTKFHPYAGIFLDEYAGHIHYVVDGYTSLAWAIPLETDGFLVKELKSRENYSATINAFFKKINLKTNITFNTQLSII